MTFESHWVVGLRFPGSSGQPTTHFYLVKDVTSLDRAWRIARQRANETAERAVRGNVGAEECAGSIFSLSRDPIGHWRWREQSLDTFPADDPPLLK